MSKKIVQPLNTKINYTDIKKFAQEVYNSASKLRIKQTIRGGVYSREVLDVHLLLQEIVLSNPIGETLLCCGNRLNVRENGCLIEFHPTIHNELHYSGPHLAMEFTMTWNEKEEAYQLKVQPTPWAFHEIGAGNALGIEHEIIMFYVQNELYKRYGRWANNQISEALQELNDDAIYVDEYGSMAWAYGNVGASLTVPITKPSKKPPKKKSKTYTLKPYKVTGDEHGHVAWFKSDK